MSANITVNKNMIILVLRVIDGVNNRYCIAPGENPPDYASQDVIEAVSLYHTPEVIENYQAMIKTNEPQIGEGE